ncbi:amino acid dehydrogenase [Sphingorhabdus lutea]|uniref:Amino acid dehydrogenase n=1 Tax=Sphingorhabdus lutea TaxID=1913578 RepID=A0A1L3JFA9_9SPHN|nr:Glu/Leu/Phe/Val dehydrogenase dimerization domain-containing protein [Sphingorhabdus lutea]APG63743.1 amino acid dehydrogenase [Sphingorhabdus lutea]
MTSIWELPDFDAHEAVHVVEDYKSGLRSVIAVHSTNLGPAAGGTRFWHYAQPQMAITDALRLSRGMSYKNAMAGLPLGGGKAVILADAKRTKTPEMLAAFGRAINQYNEQYVTAEDVGMSDMDMVEISKQTKYVAGLPVSDPNLAGGDPGPYTAYGVYLGIKAAAKHKLGVDDMRGVRVAIQGVGSVGGGVAKLLAKDGAILILADLFADKAAKLAEEIDAAHVDLDNIMTSECDIFSPNALGAVLNQQSIAALKCQIVAGGANNQFATARDSQILFERGILYAPDYVINAGGIINVGLEYLGNATVDDVNERIKIIPQRLSDIWKQSEETNIASSKIADQMAQKLIGR